jgi:sulfur relay (sulfurtransferase) DsrC/TusE family protein
MIDLTNDKDLLSIAKTVSEVIQEKALDKVDKKELDKKFKDREDKDIDNDGDVDDSDEYLHKKRKAISKAIGEDITEAELELVQAVEKLFVENFRTLATKGMGMFDKKFKLSIGQEMDYYEPKQGDKKGGVITKISGTGYSIKDDKTGKVHTFKFYDKTKAKKMLAEVDEPQAPGEKDFKDKHSVDKKDNPEDNKQG